MKCPNCDESMDEADLVNSFEEVVATIYNCPNAACGYHETR